MCSFWSASGHSVLMVWFGTADPGTPDNKSPLPATITTLSHAASLWLVPALANSCARGDLPESLYHVLLTCYSKSHETGKCRCYAYVIQ